MTCERHPDDTHPRPRRREHPISSRYEAPSALPLLRARPASSGTGLAATRTGRGERIDSRDIQHVR